MLQNYPSTDKFFVSVVAYQLSIAISVDCGLFVDANAGKAKIIEYLLCAGIWQLKFFIDFWQSGKLRYF
jgi:hypothetical protein